MIKQVLTGLLALVLMALICAGVWVLAFAFGWDAKMVLVPVLGVFLLILLVWLVRTLSVRLSLARSKRRLLLDDPRKAGKEEVLTGREEAVQRSWDTGLAHLGKSPLVLLLGTTTGQAASLGRALSQPLQSDGTLPLQWFLGRHLTLLGLELFGARPMDNLGLPENTPERVREEQEERRAWDRFLLNVRKVRAEEPAASFVVAVGARELLAAAGTGLEAARAARSLVAEAGQLRLRMEEVLRLHKSLVPLHLVITGLEDIPGFADWTGRLATLSRQELLGCEFAVPGQGQAEALDAEQPDVPHCVQACLAFCADQLRAIVLREACAGNMPQGHDLDLGANVQELEQGLVLFLEALLLPWIVGRTPFVRSMHLVSLQAGKLTEKDKSAAPASVAQAQGFARTDTGAGAGQKLAADRQGASPLNLSAPLPGEGSFSLRDMAEPVAVGQATGLGAGLNNLGEGAGSKNGLGSGLGTASSTGLSPVARTASGPVFVPSFVSALFARVARDQTLRLSLEEGSVKDRPRALAYGLACLGLLGLCGLFSAVTLHTTRVLHTQSSLWQEAQRFPATSADGLLKQAQAVHFLVTAQEEFHLPGLGLSTLDQAFARTGQIFVHNFTPLQNRVLDECRALAQQGPGGSYTAMQRMRWLDTVSQDALNHLEGKARAAVEPFPLDSELLDEAGSRTSPAGKSAAATTWTPEFGQLFVTATRAMTKTELTNLQKNLAALSSSFLGRELEPIFTRLTDLETATSPRGEYPLSLYWPSAPRGSSGFASVPAQYTPGGHERIATSLNDLVQETGQNFRDQPFWKHYLDRYAQVWADFVAKVDNAWRVTDNVETLQRISVQGAGLKDPYFLLLQDLPAQLAPLYQEDVAPAWADEIRLLRALLLVCKNQETGVAPKDPRGLVSVFLDAIRLEKADLQVLQAEIRERHSAAFLIAAIHALEEYLAALKELRGTLADPEGSLALAAIEFGGKDFGDPKGTALAKARLALERLAAALGHEGLSRSGKKQVSPGLFLVAGPLRFLEQAIAYQAATTLQQLWESEVLPQAVLLPEDESLEGLFGEKGLVNAFATKRAAPFLARTIGHYKPRVISNMGQEVTFPLADDFLTFLQQGAAAQANPLREAYKVDVHTSAARTNPDAAERLEYYQLSLLCKNGRQQVRNANYPNAAVFDYEPQQCSQARLDMSFPSLKLSWTYEDFRQFLEEFALGERVFTRADFPEQAGRMERLRISSIELRIRADEGSQILSAFTGELILPMRIVSVW